MNDMHIQPLVSIIIPTYNHAHFIQEALASVCAQSYEHWEAIVVNNYSEDNTIEVVESFKDSRIRLENFHNHGVIATSRNHAIALAQGEFLAFLDSDDLWFPEKLAECMCALDESTDLVCHGLQTFGDGVEYEFFGGPESSASFDALLYGGNCLTPSSTIVRKNSVMAAAGFSENPEMMTSEDYHLWIKLAKSGVRMTFLAKVLGLYRIHSMSQSSAIVRHLSSVLAVIEDFFPSVSERSLLDVIKIRRRYCIAYYAAARECQKKKNYQEATEFLAKASFYWPLNVRVYVAIGINILGRLRFFH